MDERHWWIAGKIQESFHIGGYDNPTLLEDFLCEPGTLDMINQFLGPGGLSRLFLYCNKPETGTLSTRQLHITGSIGVLKEVENIEKVIILYFLRHTTDKEVDAHHIERDVYCGELKGNTIDNLSSVISEIYLPLFRTQKSWGQCTTDNQGQFIHNIEKFLGALQESSSLIHGSKQWVRNTKNIICTN